MTAESSYGMWWDPSDPENRVAGRLTWEPLRTPVLSLLDPPMKMWAGRDLAQDESMSMGDEFVPILHGKLADKGGVTLLACQYNGMKIGPTSTFDLAVGIVLTGVWLDSPDEAFARRVEVELPALEALLGRHPVRPTRRPNTRSRQVTLTLENRRHSWREGTIDVGWEYRWSMRQSRIATSVAMLPTMIVTSREKKSIDYWLDEWIVPTNQLLEIVTGAKSHPRAVRVWMKKNLSHRERQPTALPIWMRGVGGHDYEYDERQVLIRAPALDLNPNGLPDVVRQTRRLAGEHEVFLSQLSGVITSPDRPLRNRYLDLTSGLEAYHSQVHGVGPTTLTAFKAKRTSALEAISVASLQDTDRKFVKRWLATRPSYSLEHRLARLARDVGIIDSWTVDAHTMGVLRNDVAHGNTSTDPFVLRNAYDQAFDLARRIVLRELGIVDPAPSVTN